MSSPTSRSLALLRAAGYLAAVVERWIPQARKRVDLFGFADLAAIAAGKPILLVQTTTRSNQASRTTKVRACPGAATWLAAGGAIEVHGWAKRGNRWHCHRVEIRATDMQPVDLTPRPRPQRKRKGERQQLLPFDEAS